MIAHSQLVAHRPEVELQRNARWLSWEVAVGFGQPTDDGFEPLCYGLTIDHLGNAKLERYESGVLVAEVKLDA